MEVLELIDRLEGLVGSGMRFPLTSRTVIDEQEFLDLIDQLRVAVPEEIKQAKRLTQDREKVLSQTQVEAEDVLSAARRQVAQMLEQDELVKAAQVQADIIIEEARRSAEEMRRGADAYALDVLGGLEGELTRLLAAVRKGRATLERSRLTTDSRAHTDGREGRASQYGSDRGSERMRDVGY